jgi:DNA-binding LytR/AlgR family response regulator
MRPVRVLIVEDDPTIALELEAIAIDALDAETIMAHSVPQAAEALGSGVDVALLDVNVRGDNVFPVAWALQDRGVPFAFVTAALPHQVPAPLRHAPFLTKPYHPHDVTRLFRSHARRIRRGGRLPPASGRANRERCNSASPSMPDRSTR